MWWGALYIGAGRSVSGRVVLLIIQYRKRNPKTNALPLCALSAGYVTLARDTPTRNTRTQGPGARARDSSAQTLDSREPRGRAHWRARTSDLGVCVLEFVRIQSNATGNERGLPLHGTHGHRHAYGVSSRPSIQYKHAAIDSIATWPSRRRRPPPAPALRDPLRRHHPSDQPATRLGIPPSRPAAGGGAEACEEACTSASTSGAWLGSGVSG